MPRPANDRTDKSMPEGVDREACRGCVLQPGQIKSAYLSVFMLHTSRHSKAKDKCMQHTSAHTRACMCVCVFVIARNMQAHKENNESRCTYSFNDKTNCSCS